MTKCLGGNPYSMEGHTATFGTLNAREKGIRTMFRVTVRKGSRLLSERLFDADIVSIGRHAVNDIRIGGSERTHTISRFHAAILRNASGAYFVRDLGSKNGVCIGGERVLRRILQDGDVIQITDYQLNFEEIRPDQVILKPGKARQRVQGGENPMAASDDTETATIGLNRKFVPLFPETNNRDVFMRHLLNLLCQGCAADRAFCAKIVGDGFALPRHTLGIAGYEIPRPSSRLFCQVVEHRQAAVEWISGGVKGSCEALAIGLPLLIEGKLHLVYLEVAKDRCETGLDDLLDHLDRILKAAQELLSKEHVSCEQSDPGIFKWKETLVGNTRLACMIEVRKRLKATSQNRLNALVYGETGTGKEIAAGKIHEISGRAGKFIAVNCKEIPTNLLSDRLFGHVRGAFSEAKTDKPGAFEEAHKGTLFLDEVGCLDLERQEILLRPLREKKIVRLGDTKERETDVKILFATNEDLEEKAAKGLMRNDFLYGRVLEENPPIDLPPLRARKEDIPLLINFFIDEAMDSEVQGVDPKVVQQLWGSVYGWPANVQELRTVVTRAVASASGERRQVIIEKDIMASPATNCLDSSREKLPCENLPKLKKAECKTIFKALADCSGNLTKAARKLGLSRPTLYKKCSDYGIEPKAFKS